MDDWKPKNPLEYTPLKPPAWMKPAPAVRPKKDLDGMLHEAAERLVDNIDLGTVVDRAVSDAERAYDKVLAGVRVLQAYDEGDNALFTKMAVVAAMALIMDGSISMREVIPLLDRLAEDTPKGKKKLNSLGEMFNDMLEEALDIAKRHEWMADSKEENGGLAFTLSSKNIKPLKAKRKKKEE